MAVTESSSVTVSRRRVVAFAERDADRTVVWLRGEHDIFTVETLCEVMAGAIALDDADVVVDLSGVQFMDAATVGVIIRAREFLRLRSRSLALRSPSISARRVVDLCCLADLVDPPPVVTTGVTESASALGTWVAVRATERIDPRADAPAPKPSANDPVRVDRVSAARMVLSADVGHPAGGRAISPAHRGRR
jgi:anti-sigma B factor antagonist